MDAIGALYGASDEQSLVAKVDGLRAKFAQVEMELNAFHRNGPYFAGDSFRLVDAAFAPAFRYCEVFDTIADFGVFTNTPKVRAWRDAQQQRPSVRSAVRAGYTQLLHTFLLHRNSELSRRMVQVAKAYAKFYEFRPPAHACTRPLRYCFNSCLRNRSEG